jgi:hypothetical protein
MGAIETHARACLVLVMRALGRAGLHTHPAASTQRSMPARSHGVRSTSRNVAARVSMPKGRAPAGTGTSAQSSSSVATPDQRQPGVSGTVPGAATTASAGSTPTSVGCTHTLKRMKR